MNAQRQTRAELERLIEEWEELKQRSQDLVDEADAIMEASREMLESLCGEEAGLLGQN